MINAEKRWTLQTVGATPWLGKGAQQRELPRDKKKAAAAEEDDDDDEEKEEEKEEEAAEEEEERQDNQTAQHCPAVNAFQCSLLHGNNQHCCSCSFITITLAISEYIGG